MKKQYSLLIPYIKPTRRKHSSGYNVFECGYLDKSEGANPTRKYVLSMGTDHVYNGFTALQEAIPSLNMDLTNNGYIRIWSNDGYIKWRDEIVPLSDMEISFGIPTIELNQLEEIKNGRGKN